jgi:serine/threonine protein kinase
VFLAWDPLLARNVALKVPRPEALLAPELRRRFLREAQVAAGLDPNLRNWCSPLGARSDCDRPDWQLQPGAHRDPSG